MDIRDGERIGIIGANGAGKTTLLKVLAGIEATNRALVKAIVERGIGDRVRLLGERDDMAAVYAAFDIPTLSSACGEGFPNVLGEAMACGLSCVATDNGDAAELLGRTGMVVPPRDPRALAAAWEALMALGPEARRSRGREARARIVRDYGLGLTVARYESLYDNIAAQGAASCTGPASPSSERRDAISGR